MSLGQSKLAMEMMRCSLWPIMACQRDGEVEGINEEVCGMWNFGKRIGILEIGNSFGLWRKERIKEKEKEKK